MKPYTVIVSTRESINSHWVVEVRHIKAESSTKILEKYEDNMFVEVEVIFAGFHIPDYNLTDAD